MCTTPEDLAIVSVGATLNNRAVRRDADDWRQCNADVYHRTDGKGQSITTVNCFRRRRPFWRRLAACGRLGRRRCVHRRRYYLATRKRSCNCQSRRGRHEHGEVVRPLPRRQRRTVRATRCAAPSLLCARALAPSAPDAEPVEEGVCCGKSAAVLDLEEELRHQLLVPPPDVRLGD